LARALQTICDGASDLGHAIVYAGPRRATVSCRPNALTRAVTNLVDNAARFASNIVVRLTVQSSGVCQIDVEDDGVGIAAADKAAMLEPFKRADVARTQHSTRAQDGSSGFGLGLSIAQIIAEEHGGALTLHDRVPNGLIARLTLPHPRFGS
jgi:signal transduction histidine kinase